MNRAIVSRYYRVVKRSVFTILSALSLLLCVAAVGCRVRSINRLDHLQARLFGCSLYALHGNGVVGFTFAPDVVLKYGTNDPLPAFQTFTRRIPPDSNPMDLIDPGVGEYGFGLKTSRTTGRPTGGWRTGGAVIVSVICPYWFLAALFSALPVRWLWIRRRSRHKIGVCPSCGYDLRATPERCPECGKVPEKILKKEAA